MINQRRSSGRSAALIITLALAATALTGCSQSGAAPQATANCPGDPIKLMSITTVDSPAQQTPEIWQGAQAAGLAVTNDCELGRPVQILTCDDKLDPNAGEACAREAVSEKVLAVVGGTSTLGDSIWPILTPAGIPWVGNTASSSLDNTSDLSFPLQNTLTILTAAAQGAKSLGGKKAVVVSLNVPALGGVIDGLKSSITNMGMDFADPVLMPPTATDLNQYAARAIASGADTIIPLVSAALMAPLVTALTEQGVDFTQTHFVGASTVLSSPKLLQTLGDKANGIYAAGFVWPATDTKNTGIAQYLSEMGAAGFGKATNTNSSIASWSSVHIIADLLKGQTDVSPANLVKLLNSSGEIQRPELAPTDFSKSPFPASSPFSKLRAFTDDIVLTEVKNGTSVPVTDGFVNFMQPFTIVGT
ncbi:MAG: hypothetical protein JWQ19_2054 [Subtercola sp.]|nr:hypothetical protein [Subtercola sp.]